MDFIVSRKEKRVYKGGLAEVLLDNICDLFPVFGDDEQFTHQEIYSAAGKIPIQDRKNYIVDVRVLNDSRSEMLDRSMFAMMKQRGGDPTEPKDGIQWAEAVIGEVPVPLIMQQVQKAVAEEGSGVKVEAFTVKNGGKENLSFKISLAGVV